MESKVSIIIPNFNRAHLIPFTLESVRNQSYCEWECIIVDDHSTDNSLQIIQEFISQDERFKLVKRPQEKPKGANSCRNYGFELSTGEFIQWFDSDDIMVQDHIECLVKGIQQHSVDFAVGDSCNFAVGRGLLGKPYNFDRTNTSMDPEAFGQQRIGWITDDFLGKKKILDNIRFNEYLTDGDEYNFFTRLLHENTNGIFINKILTYRRLHDGAISNYTKLTDLEFKKKIAEIKFQTCLDIEPYHNKELIKWFLRGYMQYSFELGLMKVIPPFYRKSLVRIYQYFGLYSSIQFLISIVSANFFGVGYKLLKEAKGS